MYGYYVLRCTTDKLEEMLNGFAEGWEVEQITHTGGRDWVVIARMEFDDAEQRDGYVRTM
jgi:hypothetical protein